MHKVDVVLIVEDILIEVYTFVKVQLTNYCMYIFYLLTTKYKQLRKLFMLGKLHTQIQTSRKCLLTLILK